MKDHLHLRVLFVAFAIFGVGCLFLLTGCQLPDIAKLDAKIPDGNWQKARVEVTGKFTSTTLDAKGVKEDGKWKEGQLHFRHTNPWLTNASVDLEASAK